MILFKYAVSELLSIQICSLTGIRLYYTADRNGNASKAHRNAIDPRPVHIARPRLQASRAIGPSRPQTGTSAITANNPAIFTAHLQRRYSGPQWIDAVFNTLPVPTCSSTVFSVPPARNPTNPTDQCDESA